MYPRYVARLFRRNGGRRWVALRSLLLLMNLAPRAPGSEHILRICPHFSAVIRGKSRRYMHRSRRGGNAGQWSWLTDLVDGIELYVSYIFRELSIRHIYRRHVASRRGQITRPPPHKLVQIASPAPSHLALDAMVLLRKFRLDPIRQIIQHLDTAEWSMLAVQDDLA
jgi:hypothetical protein